MISLKKSVSTFMLVSIGTIALSLGVTDNQVASAASLKSVPTSLRGTWYTDHDDILWRYTFTKTTLTEKGGSANTVYKLRHSFNINSKKTKSGYYKFTNKDGEVIGYYKSSTHKKQHAVKAIWKAPWGTGNNTMMNKKQFQREYRMSAKDMKAYF